MVEVFASGPGVLYKSLSLDDVEIRQRNGGAERMARIGEAVRKWPVEIRALLKPAPDPLTNDASGKRKIAAGQPFRDRHEIRLHAVETRSEIGA